MQVKCRYFFYTRCKMHITPAMLKKYSVYSFLNRSKLAFVSFQKKNSPQKMLMSCLCLGHVAYLNKVHLMCSRIC